MPARRPAAPPRKTTRTAARPERSRAAGGGALAAGLGRAGGRLLGALGGAIRQRPVLFGSVALFAILAGSVADNAFNRQTGRHAHPMLTTRAEPGETRPTLRAARTEPGSDAASGEPVIRNDPRILAFPMVEEAQALLAEMGYYRAVVDGRAGQATDLAVRAYQGERGIRVDGSVTQHLLDRLRADAAPTEEGTEVASIEAILDDASTGSTRAAPSGDLVRRIQEGLAALRVAELEPDGIMGEQTRAAIRTFQALNGMDVTGEPSAEVLARLAAAGGR